MTISRAVSVTVLCDAVRLFQPQLTNSGPPAMFRRAIRTRDCSEDLGYRPWSSSRFWRALAPKKRGRMEVTLGDNDRLDYVLKKFRRQITRAGLFQDMKRKRFYESPSAQRRRKDKAAARRKVKSARRREHH